MPFFVRWPGRVSKGSRCEQTICHVDLFATCAEIVGFEIAEGAAEDSHSFLDAMQGQNFTRPEPVIHHSAKGMFAIRQGNWKLIAGNGSGGRAKPAGQPFMKPYQLYNLVSDLGESRNVATQHPEIVEQLTEELTRVRASQDAAIGRLQ